MPVSLRTDRAQPEGPPLLLGWRRARRPGHGLAGLADVNTPVQRPSSLTPGRPLTGKAIVVTSSLCHRPSGHELTLGTPACPWTGRPPPCGVQLGLTPRSGTNGGYGHRALGASRGAGYMGPRGGNAPSCTLEAVCSSVPLTYQVGRGPCTGGRPSQLGAQRRAAGPARGSCASGLPARLPHGWGFPSRARPSTCGTPASRNVPTATCRS